MQPVYNVIITTHLPVNCDFFLNEGHLFKIYKDLCSFNYWLYKFTPTCVIKIDTKNPDEQLHSNFFFVKRKKILLQRNWRNNEN